MDASSWNAIANQYSEEVLSVFDNDHDDVIAKQVARFSSRRHTVADIGCGPGKFLTSLASQFKHVHAIDFSSAFLRISKQTCFAAGVENVDYHRINLCRKLEKLPYPKVDFAVCVNALLEPDLTGRLHMWDKLENSVKRGGHLLLVVPALESALLAHARLVHWSLDEGLRPRAALESEFLTTDSEQSTPIQILREGVVDRGGTLTKHFFREELDVELPRHGFNVLSVGKIEYDWATEFSDPPPTMQQPYPWDWMVVARKGRIQ